MSFHDISLEDRFECADQYFVLIQARAEGVELDAVWGHFNESSEKDLGGLKLNLIGSFGRPST